MHNSTLMSLFRTPSHQERMQTELAIAEKELLAAQSNCEDWKGRVTVLESRVLRLRNSITKVKAND